MASSSTTDKLSRKPYTRMVQPALPLIPGLKHQKAKPIAVEPETELPDSELTPQSLNNGEVLHTETQPIVEESGPDTLQNGFSGEKEDYPSAESFHSHQPTAAPPELPAAAYNDDGEIETEVDADEGSPDAGSQAEDVLETANNKMPDPASEIPGTETGFGPAAAIAANGRLPETPESPVEEGDNEKQESEVPGLTLSEEIDPTTTPAYANGTGLSHSTPSENDAFMTQQEEVNHGYGGSQASVSAGGGDRDQTVNGYPQPSTTSFAGTGTVPRSFTALPSLQEHLVLLSASKEGVDILIQINPSNAQPFVSYSHSVILFRSLRLRRLVTRQQQASNNYGSNVITLYPARYVMPHAFEAALRFLYSDTVLGKDFFVQPHAGADFQTVRLHNLDYLLSYWVSGIELGLEPVSICAERLLSNYLDWDILEITYKYAIELANSPVLSHGKNITGSDYLVASSSIVKLILQFLASHIDIKNFKLDAASSTNLIPPRLPQLDDGRPRHNPVLASMVFGSMPSSADMSPSSPQSEILPTASAFKDTVASNILLNVDFENLNAFNNFIQAPTIRDAATTKLMSDVIREREARRQKMYTSRIPNKERMASSAVWEPVGLKESITETNVLTRDRVGFLASSK